jgi:hypothetical protein
MLARYQLWPTTFEAKQATVPISVRLVHRAGRLFTKTDLDMGLLIWYTTQVNCRPLGRYQRLYGRQIVGAELTQEA